MSDDKPVLIPKSSQHPEPFYPEMVNVQAAYGRDESDGVHLLDYWRVLVTRRWTILAILLTSVAVTFIWVMKQTPIYQATVTIEIDRDNPNVLPFKDAYDTAVAGDDMLKSQIEVLRSRTLARHVIEDLHLEKLESQPAAPDFLSSLKGSVTKAIKSPFASSTPAPSPSSAEEPDTIRPIVDSYVGRIIPTQVPNSRLVKVAFESDRPELAARIINAHAEHFIDDNFQFKVDAAERAKQFLTGQLVTMRGNLEKAQDALQAYGRDHQILFTEGGHSTADQKLQDLDTRKTGVLADRAQRSSYCKLISDAKPEELLAKADTLPQVHNNSQIAALSSRLTQLRSDDAVLALKYDETWKDRKLLQIQIQETDRALKDEKSKLIKTIQTDCTAVADNERILGTELDRQKGVVNQLNQDSVQYNILKGDVDSSKSLYDGLLTKLNEADVSSTLRASNIRIVDKAEVPRSPIRPRKTTAMLLSILVGLGLGIGLAFFQDFLDDSIKSTEELSRLYNLPSLGIIPKLGSLGRRGYGYYKLAYGKSESAGLPEMRPLGKIEIIAHEAPMSILSEAYRSIRTSLMLSSPDHAPRTILVTSAVTSEGKTVTAINTAISLSQLGGRVAIVDADMRKPRIHSILKIKNTVGLSAVLTGSAPLSEVIRETSVPGLFAIPCGAIPPNPSELLVSRTFQQVLATLSQQFDYVVLDSPPVNLVSDPRILGSMCDRIVLVVRALSTSRHQVRQAVNHLSDSRHSIAGIVLNDLDAKRGPYYSGQYYSGRYYGRSG